MLKWATVVKWANIQNFGIVEMQRQIHLIFTISYFPTIEIVHTNFRTSIRLKYLRAWSRASTASGPTSTTARAFFSKSDFDFAYRMHTQVSSVAMNAIGQRSECVCLHFRVTEPFVDTNLDFAKLHAFCSNLRLISLLYALMIALLACRIFRPLRWSTAGARLSASP